MKKIMILMTAAMLAGCSSRNTDFDATGTFEATEVTVSAEQNGRLLSFALNEGEEVSAGTALGLIDTVALSLQLEQARATRQVYAVKISVVNDGMIKIGMYGEVKF